MAANCFRIDARDNVATMLGAADLGVATVRNGTDINSIELLEPIDLGHKVALSDIAAGQEVIKFGVPIGRASCRIPRGTWVHLHNCTSDFDTRSGTLDLHSGATTDTKYE